LLHELRIHAKDRRWRVREGVAMTIQRFGDKEMGKLLQEMEKWSHGDLLERRAAIAGICEPRLLSNAEDNLKVLEILDEITEGIVHEDQRKTDEFLALKKALGYCWSVAVASAPGAGKKAMEKWILYDDQ